MYTIETVQQKGGEHDAEKRGEDCWCDVTDQRGGDRSNVQGREGIEDGSSIHVGREAEHAVRAPVSGGLWCREPEETLFMLLTFPVRQEASSYLRVWIGEEVWEIWREGEMV